ncbi:MAG: hypothetical protein LBT65_02995, partial [Synergistaceae bacterium]|nr:hypothetical protein [Synergistaceae bacterium]
MEPVMIDSSSPPESNAVELDVFGAANFDSVVHADEVWGRMPFHVDDLHRAVRERILVRLSQARAEGISSGCVVIGDPGMGRTHLVGSLRRAIFERPEFHGVTFLRVETEDRESRRTQTDRVLDSLTRRFGDSGDSQLQSLLLHLMTFLGKNGDAGRRYLRVLERSEMEWLERDISKICDALRRKHGALPGVIRDVLRAFFALNCSDGRADAAQAWLRGTESKKPTGEKRKGPPPDAPQWRPREIFASVVRLLNLRGTVFLVADQASATTENFEAGAASLTDALASVVENLSGVMALLSLPRSLWLRVQENSRALARFSAQETLDPIPDAHVARKLVTARMGDACRRKNFTPPSPTWPFKSQAFVNCGISPRELLTRCARHRDECLRQGGVIELSSFGVPKQPTPSLPPALMQYSNGIASSNGPASPSGLSGRVSDAREREKRRQSAAFDGIVEVEARREEITLGLSSALVGQVAPATLPLRALRGHAIILEDEEADKTALLRRIIGESALFGVPSVVIDGRGDPSGLSVSSGANTAIAGDIFDLSPENMKDTAREIINRTLEGVRSKGTAHGKKGRAPVSIVNLGGLSGATKKRTFVERMTNALLELLSSEFSESETLLSGAPASEFLTLPAPEVLLAINETRDLANMLLGGGPLSLPTLGARRHGLGLILAAPYPEDDKTPDGILENFDTCFLGRARSPRALSEMKLPGCWKDVTWEETI